MATRLRPGQYAFENDRTIVAYYVRGRGPPCFVAPYPWGLNSDVQRSFFRRFEKYLTLIYHDPPGTGRSGPAMAVRDLGMKRVVSDIFSLQSRLEVGRAAFIGHSGGSACALSYALRHPERVSKLVLIGAGARMPDVLQHPQVRETLFAAGRERDEDAFRRLLANYLGPEIRTRAGKIAMGRAVKSGMNFNLDRAAYSFEELGRWDVGGELGGLDVRTLIMAGRHDRLTPPSLARELKRAVSKSRLVTFAESGHFPFLDEPKRFQEEVLSFLEVDVRLRGQP